MDRPLEVVINAYRNERSVSSDDVKGMLLELGYRWRPSPSEGCEIWEHDTFTQWDLESIPTHWSKERLVSFIRAMQLEGYRV